MTALSDQTRHNRSIGGRKAALAKRRLAKVRAEIATEMAGSKPAPEITFEQLRANVEAGAQRYRDKLAERQSA